MVSLLQLVLELNRGFSSPYAGGGRIAEVVTPLRVDAWDELLKGFLDADVTCYIIQVRVPYWSESGSQPQVGEGQHAIGSAEPLGH